MLIRGFIIVRIYNITELPHSYEYLDSVHCDLYILESQASEIYKKIGELPKFEQLKTVTKAFAELFTKSDCISPSLLESWNCL